MKHPSMYKLLTLLLAICLLPLAALSEGSADRPSEYFGRRLVDASDNVSSMALVDGTAYVLTNKTLYALKQGDSEVKALGKLPNVYEASRQGLPAADVLFQLDGKLLGLNRQNGILYALSFDDTGIQYTEHMKLDWDMFIVSEGGHSYANMPVFAMLEDGQLYLKLENYGGDKEKDLVSYDLKTGAIKAYTPRHLNSFIPYKDGKLLAMYFDQNDTDPTTMEPLPPKVMVFDPAADSAEEMKLMLPSLGRDGYHGMKMYYDQAKDQLYGINSYGVYRLSGQEPLLVSRLPMAGAWAGSYTTMPVLPDGADELLIGFGRHLFRRGLDEKKLKPVISLRVNLDMLRSEALSLSLIQHEDIELVPVEIDGSQINQLFLTREMDLDVLVMESGYNDLQRLMQKGYLLPLDSDPAMKKMGEGLFPAFERITRDQGRLYLLPMNMHGTYVEHMPDYFKAIGREVPKSFDELLSFTEWWAKEGAKQNPDYNLFEMAGARNTLEMYAYELYIDSQNGQGIPLKFDMEHFGAMMQRIAAIDYNSFGLDPATMNEEDMGMMGGKPLITPYIGYTVENGMSPENLRMLPLPLTTGELAYHQGRSIVAGIPATAKQPEAALRLLSSYFDNLRDAEKAAVSAAWDQPIPNPSFEDEMADLQSSLSRLKQQLEKAEGDAEKREAGERIQDLEKRIARFEKERRYQFSQEGIQFHRQYMQGVYFDTSLTQTQRSALSKDGYLLGSYQSGALSLEQFMQQANDKIRLMTLEMQ